MAKVLTEEFDLTLIGDTHLIAPHNDQWWMIAEEDHSHGRKSDPWELFSKSLNWISQMPETPTEDDVMGGTFGIDVHAIKYAAIKAAFENGLIAKRTMAMGAFMISGGLTEIHGKHKISEKVITGSTGSVCRIKMLEYPEWYINIHVRLNPDLSTKEELVKWINLGGKTRRIGIWRADKDGGYGTFHVAP